MSGPKRQHYVPQTYLKQFTFDNAKDPHIYAMSKDNRKIFESGIQNVAVEKKFYTVEACDNKFEWEEYYSRDIESVFGPLLREIIERCEPVLAQSKMIVLTQDEKKSLSECVQAQMFRGKPAREKSKDLYWKELPNRLDDIKRRFGPIDEEMEQVLESYKNEDKCKQILMGATMMEKPRALWVLMDMLFLFIKINGARTFVTSDNPVMVTNLSTGDATPFANGLADISSAIYYPLSPKLLLFAVHKTPLMDSSELKDCSLNITDANKDSDWIDAVNRHQLKYCCNWVYSQTRDELENLQKNK